MLGLIYIFLKVSEYTIIFLVDVFTNALQGFLEFRLFLKDIKVDSLGNSLLVQYYIVMSRSKLFFIDQYPRDDNIKQW